MIKKVLAKIIADFKKEYSALKQEYLKSLKLNYEYFKYAQKQTLKISPDDIKKLFNNYADHFEDHLVNALNYQSPQIICRMLKEAAPYACFQSVVDLGCGTGLMGQYLKTHFKVGQLIGIDFAAEMLKIAQKKQIYDELIENNVLNFTENISKNNDLIVMTDTLVYIKAQELDQLFANIYQVTADNGLFGFDFEVWEGKQDFYLSRTGRSVYHNDYIVKKLKKFNFLPVLNLKETIRYEFGEPALGSYIIARSIK